MAVSYPLALPSSPIPSGCTIRMETVQGAIVSPYSGARQVLDWGGALWSMTLAFPRMDHQDAQAFLAFLTALHGTSGTFAYGDPYGQKARGSAADIPGTPLVRGANQVGYAINIDGLPADTNGYLLAGDYIGLGSGLGERMHKVLTDADSDAQGRATLDIWPPIDRPADNAAVKVAAARSVWRLTAGAEWSVEQIVFGIGITATEAI